MELLQKNAFQAMKIDTASVDTAKAKALILTFEGEITKENLRDRMRAALVNSEGNMVQ